METYVVVRAHGLRTHLLKPEDYEKLLGTANVKEFIYVLSDTDYRNVVEQLPEEVEASDFRKALFKKYMERVNILEKNSPDGLRQFLRNYALGRFEVVNIKHVLRAKAGGSSISVHELFPVKLNVVKWNEPLGLERLDDVVRYLARRGYPTLDIAFSIYRRNRLLDVLECALEADYYDSLHRLIEKLKLRELEDIVREEADIRWLYWIIDLKARRANLSEVKSILDKYGGKASEELWSHALKYELEDFIFFLSRFRRYRRIIPQLRRGLRARDYLLVEDLLRKRLYDMAVHYLLYEPVSLTYVLSFLLLCEAEMCNLMILFSGKKARLHAHELRPFIFLPLV
ncbi:MAG: hypothetical protein DRN15_06565 [Thermoprotei archaeon]|nr:MAG: hypothetical protein DRN15_06565 [Thermoprotei archaeon]